MQKYDPQEPEGEAKSTEQIELLRGKGFDSYCIIGSMPPGMWKARSFAEK